MLILLYTSTGDMDLWLRDNRRLFMKISIKIKNILLIDWNYLIVIWYVRESFDN